MLHRHSLHSNWVLSVNKNIFNPMSANLQQIASLFSILYLHIHKMPSRYSCFCFIIP